jgi:ABC-type lipoprotein release transport system permease subunit
MILFKIAFRNIFRHKRRSALTSLMMAGGCFLFAIFIGVIDGSYGNLIDMFTRDHTGHIQIHSKGYLDKPSIYTTLDNPDSIGSKLKPIDHIQAWAPRAYTSALAFAGKKTTGVQIMGIDPEKESVTTRIKHKVEKGRFISSTSLNEVVIGDGLARILKVDINSEIALIAQGADGSIANDLFTVVGITAKGLGSGSASISYMHINSIQKFLSLGNRIHEIAVVLSDHSKAMKTASLIKAALGDASLEVDPWQVVESQFYRAMQADIKGNWYTIVVFTIIIAFGVLNTILMIIFERTREFGVLKAIGTRPFQIFLLIMLESIFLSIISIIIGSIMGIFANWMLSIYGIAYPVPIEYGGYVFDKLTAKITIRSLVLPTVIIFGTALLVSILPALRAARIIPVKAMRAH